LKRPTRLKLETLEHRDQPTVFGVPWANAQNLTLSFASDGVKAAPINGYGDYSISELFKELNTNIPTATWQFEILKAFQTWAAPANINIGLVNDNSTSFGDFEADRTQTPNGELRIGAVPLSPTVAGITTPFHLLSGNRSGDVLLNMTHSFTIGGANGTRDLYTVMLNEASNALGLDDTIDSTSARYGRYSGVRSGISTADRTSIVNMYGARTNDIYDRTANNSTFATASVIPLQNPPGRSNVFIATADGSIASTTDIDFYRVTTRRDTNSLFVRLNTAGRSLFTGKVEVFNAARQLVTTRSITNPLSGDINFTVPGAAANSNYFVKVTPARTDVFGVGTYRLQVGMNQDPRNFTPADPLPYINYGSDNGTNDWITTAQRLTYTTPGSATGTRYQVRAQLENGAAERDTYSVVVPNTGKPLSVVIDPVFSNKIKPEVHLYRAGYSLIDSLRLVQTPDGRYVLQSRAPIVAGETLYVVVKGVAGSTGSEPYDMLVDFTTPAVSSNRLAEGTMAPGNTSHAMRMTVAESTFFHFALEAWRNVYGPYGNGSQVRAEIINSLGQVVDTLSASSGLSSSQVYLAAGTYTVRFTGLNAAGQISSGAWYQFRGVRLSDPIDVYDLNDHASHTPPVTFAYLDPIDDSDDLWYIADPWSEPIG
jgi:hypothetical protein